MPYIVRVRGVQIECTTLDDVDVIVARYGVDSPGDRAGARDESASRETKNGLSRTDIALLKQLVAAASSGVTSNVIGGLLGAEKKGIPGALARWASRVGLPKEAFMAARPGGKRGWRLNDGALHGAKEILEQG